MTIVGYRATSELDRAIERYSAALSELEESAPNPSREQILKVLLGRDAVEEALQEKTKASEESIATLIELDSRLKKQAGALAADSKLADCRQSLKPPESAWWWFLEPLTQQADGSDRFRWVWQGLTVGCLILAGSFATSTVKAFSANGMDLLQLFGTISQGAGLVLVTGGVLTEKGQKTVQNVLSSLKIPPQLHAEATFGASAVLLLATYGVNKSLPKLGEFYYQQGNQNYDKGELSKALKNYQEANSFIPDSPKIQVAIGKIYESQGQFDEAKSYYQKGLLQGDPASFNGLGSAILDSADNSEDAFAAETYFRMALKDENVSDVLKAKLYTNLGVALMKRASFGNLPPKQTEALLEKAKENFQVAIALEKKIPQETPGWGMASCHLANLLQEKGSLKDAAVQWQSCENAKPETIAQYEMILGSGPDEIAQKVQTKYIVNEDPRTVSTAQPVAADTGTAPDASTPQPVTAEISPSAPGETAQPVAAEASPAPAESETAQSVAAATGAPPPPPSASPAAETLPSEQLEELQQNLYSQLDQNWSASPTFDRSLVYRVKISKEGAIAGYEAIDKLASDFVQETPLPQLTKSDPPSDSLIQFKVVFTPLGKIEVSPWQL